MHAYLSRDGMPPDKFPGHVAREVLRYPGRTLRTRGGDHGAARNNRGFVVTLAGKRNVHCRKLLIATGLFDIVPRIPGIDELFGRSVFQCPYCDGWEMRGRKIAVYGSGQRGFEMARAMTAWTRTSCCAPMVARATRVNNFDDSTPMASC